MERFWNSIIKRKHRHHFFYNKQCFPVRSLQFDTKGMRDIPVMSCQGNGKSEAVRPRDCVQIKHILQSVQAVPFRSVFRLVTKLDICCHCFAPFFFSYFKPLLFSLLFCIPVSAGASKNAMYCKSRTHGPCASFCQSLIRKRFVFARPSFRYVTSRYGRPSRIRNSSTFS